MKNWNIKVAENHYFRVYADEDDIYNYENIFRILMKIGLTTKEPNLIPSV